MTEPRCDITDLIVGQCAHCKPQTDNALGMGAPIVARTMGARYAGPCPGPGVSVVRIGALFAGYGGLEMAVQAVTGAETVWVSDIDPGACKILAHHWPTVPNLGDITEIDWATVEPVDIITGGFPCQDVSMAGRRAGMQLGTRSGLWSQMVNAIAWLRPALVVAENVRGLLSADGHADVEPCPWCMGDAEGEPVVRALGVVLADLADIGYDAAWYGITAASIGAPHGRFRVFIIAWPQSGNPDSSNRDGWPPAGLARQTGPETGLPANADPFGWDGWSGEFGTGRWGQPTDSGHEPSDADRRGLEVGERIGSDACQELPTPRGSSDAATDTAVIGCWSPRGGDGLRVEGLVPATVQWGQFGPAIRRWESLTRPAPAPTETGPKGGQRLSPRFVEWMQGLPDGHVTGVPGLTRNEQLKALGNGVVVQQAEAALRYLFAAVGAA